MPAPGSAEALQREAWLAAALDVLRREGVRGVRIVTIARALSVSTGSFYLHFRDRDDLLRGMLGYWAAEMTDTVVRELEEASELAPQARLHLLMESITGGHRADYEVSIRAWASTDPAAARVVRKVDQLRLETLRGVFRDLGFHGDELEMRVRLFLAAEMGEPALLVRESGSRRRKLLELRHAFFTRP